MRESSIPIRFAIGERRLLVLRIPVLDVRGHFLDDPVTVEALNEEFERRDGQRAVLGRSVPDAAADVEALSGARRIVKIVGRYQRHFVDLRGSWDEYLATFSSKTRSTLLRKLRKFEDASKGSLDWETFRTRDQVDQFLDEAIPLSERTYQHRLLGSGLPSNQAFREELRNLASNGQFRGWVLRLDQRPVAYICGMGTHASILYEYVGFEPDISSLSPGTVLQLLVLEQLFADQSFRYFDFTEGEGSHKALFGTGSVLCTDVLIAPRNFVLPILFGMQAVFAGGVRSVASVAARLGLKARLRKLIRGGGSGL